jgi:hypothetical protein
MNTCLHCPIEQCHIIFFFKRIGTLTLSHTITILLKPDSLYILNIRKTKTKTDTKLLKRRGHQRRCGRL